MTICDIIEKINLKLILINCRHGQRDLCEPGSHRGSSASSSGARIQFVSSRSSLPRSAGNWGVQRWTSHAFSGGAHVPYGQAIRTLKFGTQGAARIAIRQQSWQLGSRCRRWSRRRWYRRWQTVSGRRRRRVSGRPSPGLSATFRPSSLCRSKAAV